MQIFLVMLGKFNIAGLHTGGSYAEKRIIKIAFIIL
jgi:hypothetical protein